MASPMFLRCPKARRWARSGRAGDPATVHQLVRLPDEPRPNPSRNRAGGRTLDHRYRYRCSCGHTGWTIHVDVLRLPLADPGPGAW